MGKKVLYIPDADNNRVLGFKKIPKKNGASAKLVLGQTNFSNSGSGTSSTSFEFPSGVATTSNQLFVVEFDNSRVLIWNKLPTKTNTPADVVVGQPNFTTNDADHDPIGSKSPGNRFVCDAWQAPGF